LNTPARDDSPDRAIIFAWKHVSAFSCSCGENFSTADHVEFLVYSDDPELEPHERFTSWPRWISSRHGVVNVSIWNGNDPIPEKVLVDWDAYLEYQGRNREAISSDEER